MRDLSCDIMSQINTYQTPDHKPPLRPESELLSCQESQCWHSDPSSLRSCTFRWLRLRYLESQHTWESHFVLISCCEQGYLLKAYTDVEMNIPFVAVSIVAQWISNSDLGSIESFSATVQSVGDCDVVDYDGRSEVYSPPGSIIIQCVRYGPLVPVASTTPINSILRTPPGKISRWLCSNSTSCPISPLKEAWKTSNQSEYHQLCQYVIPVTLMSHL